jgi:hypothetical protein
MPEQGWGGGQSPQAFLADPCFAPTACVPAAFSLPRTVCACVRTTGVDLWSKTQSRVAPSATATYPPTLVNRTCGCGRRDRSVVGRVVRVFTSNLSLRRSPCRAGLASALVPQGVVGCRWCHPSVRMPFHSLLMCLRDARPPLLHALLIVSGALTDGQPRAAGRATKQRLVRHDTTFRAAVHVSALPSIGNRAQATEAVTRVAHNHSLSRAHRAVNERARPSKRTHTRFYAQRRYTCAHTLLSPMRTE